VAGLVTDPAARQQHKGIPLAPHILEVDLATGSSLGPLTLLRTGVVGNGVSEGSHLLKREGIYYLLTADGGTEVAHQEWICRNASSPFGPWEVGPQGVNPLVFNNNHPEVQQTGHLDMVEGPDGRWWAVFLGVRPVKGGDKSLLSQLGRETFLAPLTWKDGWPIVNDGQPISLTGPSSAGLTRVEEHFQKSFLFSPGQGKSSVSR
jgi:beta-xylosidase